MSGRTKGFSLVELVVVIAIVGILLTIAMPKFGDHHRTARAAKVGALGGAIESAAALSKATAYASGVSCAALAATIAIETRTVTLNYCYPQALAASHDGILQAANLDASTDGLSITGGGATPGAQLTLTVDGATDPANCRVVYTAPVLAHGPFSVATATGGC